MVRMVLRQCMVPVWLGMPLGLALSAVTASALVGMVPIESGLTAGVYWFVVPVVIAVTSLAAAIPARHAARINPTVALRCE